MRLKHCVFLPLARMPFRPGFPAAAASRLVTGMAQTIVENRGATGGAEVCRRDGLREVWASLAYGGIPRSQGPNLARVGWKTDMSSAVEKPRSPESQGLVSEAGTLPVDNRVTKVLRTWTGFPVTSRKVQLETARPCLCSGPRTWL